jgi:sarcosine oxidase, subunit gamma
VTVEALERDPLAPRVGDLAAVAERTGGRVTLVHVPFLAQVSLRLDPSLTRRAPYPIPLEPNTVWEDGSRAVLWLGPDEWLVLGPPHTGGQIATELETALDGSHRSVIDVSSNRVAIEVGGPGRFEPLASGCPIDLHPRTWRREMCAQTLFAKTQVILHERADSTRVLVRPSFADYLLERLIAGLA